MVEKVADSKDRRCRSSRRTGFLMWRTAWRSGSRASLFLPQRPTAHYRDMERPGPGNWGIGEDFLVPGDRRKYHLSPFRGVRAQPSPINCRCVTWVKCDLVQHGFRWTGYVPGTCPASWRSLWKGLHRTCCCLTSNCKLLPKGRGGGRPQVYICKILNY